MMITIYEDEIKQAIATRERQLKSRPIDHKKIRLGLLRGYIVAEYDPADIGPTPMTEAEQVAEAKNGRR